MNHKIISFTLLGILFFSNLKAEDCHSAIWSQRNDDLNSGGHSNGEKSVEGKSILRRAIPYTAIFAAGGALFAVDDDIQHESMRTSLRSPTADHFFKDVEHYGTVGPYLITMPIQIGYGLIFHHRESLVNASELAVGFVFIEGVSYGIKAAFGRLRPYQTGSPYRFFKGGTSFYSGHTVTAFTYATIVATNYPRQDLSFMGIDHEVPAVPILAYSLAGLVGIQRLYSNNHWASDVYFGALAGYGCGKLVTCLGDKIYGGKLFATWRNGPILGCRVGFN
jgi:membrane-associated phospholipid phosphatase